MKRSTLKKLFFLILAPYIIGGRKLTVRLMNIPSALEAGRMLPMIAQEVTFIEIHLKMSE
ncbi:MAG: hypothetical protein WAV76_00040 [Bacteroidota bacterium]